MQPSAVGQAVIPAPAAAVAPPAALPIDDMTAKIQAEQAIIEMERKEHESRKKVVKANSDSIIVYLTLKASQHTSSLDRNYVESVFEENSVKSKGDTSVTEKAAQPDECQLITKGNAILAYEEIFKMWKVELNVEQALQVKTTNFVQAWDKFEEDGNLNLKDSWRFLKDLMTLPLIKKDPHLSNYMNVAKKNS